MDTLELSRKSEYTQSIYNIATRSFLCGTPEGKIEQSVIRNLGENWLIENIGDDKVTIRSIHGYYLSAQRFGAIEIRTNVDQWEIFKKEDLDMKTFSLLSVHQKFVAFEKVGTVRCNKSVAAAPEYFQIRPASKNTLSTKAIYSPYWGSFLSGNPRVVVKSSVVDNEQEYFEIEQTKQGYFTIRSIYGNYLSSRPPLKTQFDRQTARETEWFEIDDRGGGQFALYNYYGMCVYLDKNGFLACKVDADYVNVGSYVHIPKDQRKDVDLEELFQFKTKNWLERRFALWVLKHNKITLPNSLTREMIKFI